MDRLVYIYTHDYTWLYVFAQKCGLILLKFMAIQCYHDKPLDDVAPPSHHRQGQWLKAWAAMMDPPGTITLLYQDQWIRKIHKIHKCLQQERDATLSLLL